MKFVMFWIALTFGESQATTFYYDSTSKKMPFDLRNVEYNKCNVQHHSQCNIYQGIN